MILALAAKEVTWLCCLYF